VWLIAVPDSAGHYPRTVSEANDQVVPRATIERRPFVLGGSLTLQPSRATVLSVVAITAVIALPLRGLFRGTGSSMEEGFMLVFPKRMLAGDVPNDDFLHLYGPGSLHTLMGWYQVFGYTLESQRVFGLLQHIGIIAAVYALTRAWGHRVAVMSAVGVTLLVLTPIGLSALAWEGAVGLGLWSVVFAVRSLHTHDRQRVVALGAAGVLAGFALSYRPDLIIALGLAHGLLWWRGRAVREPLIGVVLGLIPMWIHLAMAGIGDAWTGMVTQPVRDLRPGRELPRPPSFGKIDGALQAVAEGPLDAPWWRFPALSANHQLFVWFFVVIITAIGSVVVAAVLIRRLGWTPRRTTLLAGALFGLGMLPQAMQRPDSTHLAWGSCISLALLPVLFHEIALVVRPRTIGLGRDVIAGAVLAVTLFVVCPFYTYRYYLLYSRISVGDKPGGFEVSRDGRRFYFGNEPLQRASQAAIDDLERLSRAGQRLLVGPADLSRTIYSDVVFYFMFPELTPATYFIEMDPGLADQPGSGLADDVRSADWVLLTNFWTGWYEPNASSEFGSDEPNQVVAEQFCLVGNYENALVLLYRRCAQGDGVSPAGLGIGAERRASLDRELAEHSERDER
jgi:hypothetical protein